MNTVEAARYLKTKGNFDGAFDLYEAAVREATVSSQEQETFGNNSVVAIVLQARRYFPDQKIAQIKFVRSEFPQMGLRNAKELVEAIIWNILPY